MEGSLQNYSLPGLERFLKVNHLVKTYAWYFKDKHRMKKDDSDTLYISKTPLNEVRKEHKTLKSKYCFNSSTA